LVRRVTLARPARVRVEGREQLAPRDTRRGSRLIDPGDGGSQLLVRVDGAPLQIVQRFITKDFPPRAFGNVIQRLTFLPRTERFGFVVRGYASRGGGR